MVTERAPQAVLCLDAFHVVAWATQALDEVRRGLAAHLRRTGHPERGTVNLVACLVAGRIAGLLA